MVHNSKEYCQEREDAQKPRPQKKGCGLSSHPTLCQEIGLSSQRKDKIVAHSVSSALYYKVNGYGMKNENPCTYQYWTPKDKFLEVGHLCRMLVFIFIFESLSSSLLSWFHKGGINMHSYFCRSITSYFCSLIKGQMQSNGL